MYTLRDASVSTQVSLCNKFYLRPLVYIFVMIDEVWQHIFWGGLIWLWFVFLCYNKETLKHGSTSTRVIYEKQFSIVKDAFQVNWLDATPNVTGGKRYRFPTLFHCIGSSLNSSFPHYLIQTYTKVENYLLEKDSVLFF